jgi:DNA-binding CsgD family transcriptional regulator
LWAAYLAFLEESGEVQRPQDAQAREEPLRKAAQALGSDRMRTAKERGAAMVLETAVDFAIMLTGAEAQAPQAFPGPSRLSAWERELVTLVAQGRTDAQIAGQLYISISTVRSHLDRIRDKTSCRRRADLTRLALQAGLA